MVGFLPMPAGITSAFAQGTLTELLTRRYGEVPIVRGALLFTAIGFVLMLQARSLPAVVATVFLFVLGDALPNPSVSALISKRAATSQGMAMGLNNSFLSLGRVVGPLWAGFVFDANLNLPYLTGAVIMLAGFLISMVWRSGEGIAAAGATTT